MAAAVGQKQREAIKDAILKNGISDDPKRIKSVLLKVISEIQDVTRRNNTPSEPFIQCLYDEFRRINPAYALCVRDHLEGNAPTPATFTQASVGQPLLPAAHQQVDHEFHYTQSSGVAQPAMPASTALQPHDAIAPSSSGLLSSIDDMGDSLDHYAVGNQIAALWSRSINASIKEPFIYYRGVFRVTPRVFEFWFDFDETKTSPERMAQKTSTLTVKLCGQVSVEVRPGYVALLIPRQKWEPYYLSDLFERQIEELNSVNYSSRDEWMERQWADLGNPVILHAGINSDNELFSYELDTLLVGGTRGSGKSNNIRSLVSQMCFNYHPSQLRLIVIDLKGGMEFDEFTHLPHVETLVTDPSESIEWAHRLRKLHTERTKVMRGKARNIVEYNRSAYDFNKGGWRHKPLPWIVTIVDEYAEHFVGRDETEQRNEVHNAWGNLLRIARSSGIPTILATQFPEHRIINTSIRSLCTARQAMTCTQSSAYPIILGEEMKDLKELKDIRLQGSGDSIILALGRAERVQTFNADGALDLVLAKCHEHKLFNRNWKHLGE